MAKNYQSCAYEWYLWIIKGSWISVHRYFLKVLIMVTEQLYWRNVLSVCFRSLGMFIAFMKMCSEEHTLHLYCISLMKTLCIIIFPNLHNRYRGLFLTYLRPIFILYRKEPIRLECKLIDWFSWKETIGIKWVKWKQSFRCSSSDFFPQMKSITFY